MDRKQKYSNNDSALVITLKERIDSLKQQFRDKQFIIESLLACLQYHADHSLVHPKCYWGFLDSLVTSLPNLLHLNA